MSTHEGEKTYETRIMRAAPAVSDTARRWKYANTKTGRIEFYGSAQTAEHLQLIRPPVGRTIEPME